MDVELYADVAMAGCPKAWLNYEHGQAGPGDYVLDHWRLNYAWPGGWRLYFNIVEEINPAQNYAHLTLGLSIELEDDSWEMGNIRLPGEKEERWLKAYRCWKRLDSWLQHIDKLTAKNFPHMAIQKFLYCVWEQGAYSIDKVHGLSWRHGVRINNRQTKWEDFSIHFETEGNSLHGTRVHTASVVKA